MRCGRWITEFWLVGAEKMVWNEIRKEVEIFVWTHNIKTMTYIFIGKKLYKNIFDVLDSR